MRPTSTPGGTRATVGGAGRCADRAAPVLRSSAPRRGASGRPARPGGRRIAIALGLAASLAGGASGAACHTPSSDVDGGDLLGVFERDAGVDASRDGGAPRDAGGKKRRKGADAGVEAAPAVAVPTTRPPSEGVCAAEEGQPNRELRRFLGRPACRDARVLEWRDADGSPRYACVIAPRGLEARAPLPLVLFFHAPDDDPTSVDKKTSLRKLTARFDLTGDPAHVGFIILSTQGRALKGGRYGSVFDTDFTGEANVDVAAVDLFVEELASKGLVDRRRVFALGNAEGGAMAATYSMIRADKVAAFATFATVAPRAAWSCGGPPPPALMLYRACDDAAPCDEVERWLRARDALSAETSWARLGAANEDEPSCTVRNRCTKAKGSMHHARWPKPREDQLLRFFAAHALAVSAPPAPGAAVPPATNPDDEP